MIGLLLYRVIINVTDFAERKIDPNELQVLPTLQNVFEPLKGSPNPIQ